MHAVSDPSRRAILEQLRGGPATAGRLGDGLDLSQPGVSRHLRVLREAGLVEVEDRGRERVYALTPEPMAQLDDWLAPYRALWVQRMSALHTEIARGRRAARVAKGQTEEATSATPRERSGR